RRRRAELPPVPPGAHRVAGQRGAHRGARREPLRGHLHLRADRVALVRTAAGETRRAVEPQRARKRSASATSALLPAKNGTRWWSVSGAMSSTRPRPVDAAPPAASAMKAIGAHS